MNDYTYTWSRKFPFIKKRPLTQIELIHKRAIELFNIMPIVITVCNMAKVIGWLKSLTYR